MSEPEEDRVTEKWINGSPPFVSYEDKEAKVADISAATRETKEGFVKYLIESGMSKEQIKKVINDLSENKKS